MIITIDGPAGTGKSVVAKLVAEKLGFTYFDTGAMYRSVTWAILQKEIPFSDHQQIDALLKDFNYDIRKVEGKNRYFLGEEDITEKIREQRINEAVSEISAMPQVRKLLGQIQRSYAQYNNAVFEGRDMGSVVFPDAEVKIFLDATAEVRAQRRLKEMRTAQPKDAEVFDQQKMVAELNRRDHLDKNRKIAPLTCPKRALSIDTSHLSIEEVVEKIIVHVQNVARKQAPSWLKAKKMKFFYRFIICLTWCAFKIFYRHRIYGLEHAVIQGAIIAPNHSSFLDPEIIAISWPYEIHFLARESLFKPFLFGSLIRAVNAHPISREEVDVSVFKTIFQILKEQKQLLIFPEGRRNEGEIKNLKQGIGMIALRSNALIVPTYIHGADKAWGRARKLPKLFGSTACVFGSPIDARVFAHLDKKEGQALLTKKLLDAILALKQWYEAGAKGVPP